MASSGSTMLLIRLMVVFMADSTEDTVPPWNCPYSPVQAKAKA